MLIYVRCPTCNGVLANKRLIFKELVENRGYTNKQALDELGLKNICCRTRMISFVDVVEYVLEQPYYDFKDDVKTPSKFNEFENSDDTTSFAQQEFSGDTHTENMEISDEDDEGFEEDASDGDGDAVKII